MFQARVAAEARCQREGAALIDVAIVEAAMSCLMDEGHMRVSREGMEATAAPTAAAPGCWSGDPTGVR
jgi:hypothetical protein